MSKVLTTRTVSYFTVVKRKRERVSESMIVPYLVSDITVNLLVLMNTVSLLLVVNLMVVCLYHVMLFLL